MFAWLTTLLRRSRSSQADAAARQHEATRQLDRALRGVLEVQLAVLDRLEMEEVLRLSRAGTLRARYLQAVRAQLARELDRPPTTREIIVFLQTTTPAFLRTRVLTRDPIARLPADYEDRSQRSERARSSSSASAWR